MTAVELLGWKGTGGSSLGRAAWEKKQNGFLRGEGGTELGARGEPRSPPWHSCAPIPQTARHRPPAASARCPFSWHHLEAAGTGTGGQTRGDGDGDRHRETDTAGETRGD